MISMIQMSLSSSHNGEEFKHVSTIARFHSQSRRGLIRETKIPVQKLWLKMGGGLYTRGRIRRTQRYLHFCTAVKFLMQSSSRPANMILLMATAVCVWPKYAGLSTEATVSVLIFLPKWEHVIF